MTAQTRKRGGVALHCIPEGYRYEFDGKRNWRLSSDDRWETVMGDRVCGRLLGLRTIDGSKCKVLKLPDGTIVAALAHYVTRTDGPLA